MLLGWYSLIPLVVLIWIGPIIDMQVDAIHIGRIALIAKIHII
jgi:hypothetical protein